MQPSRAVPPVPLAWRSDDERDQVVVLHGISWEQYVAITEARGDGPRPLFAYLDGDLEIVTTSRHHEWIKKMVARLVETYAEETGTSLNGIGHATFRKKAKQAGAEPDESYYGAKILDDEDPPDLVIEIVHTSGGVDKLELYRRLGVREVWFWIDGRFWVYWLDKDGYRESIRSVLMPAIDLDRIARIALATDEDKQTDAVREYRMSLRRP